MAQQNSNESQQPSVIIIKDKEEKDFGWGKILLACGVGFLFGQVMAEGDKQTQMPAIPSTPATNSTTNWKFWNNK